MAASIGNLSIVISGNARPFGQTLRDVNQSIKNSGNTFNKTFLRVQDPAAMAARARLDRARARIAEQRLLEPPGGSYGRSLNLQWGNFGRLARSALVSGFGGGLAGALVGVGAMAFGQVLEATLSAVGKIGHQAAMFLADSFQEGLKLSRMEMGVNFLAGDAGRGAEWMSSIRSLASVSGFEMVGLGQSMRTLAGSTDELDNVVPTLRAIAEISAGIGADAEQMNRFALAVSQVTAAGRFEAQELNQLTEAGMPIKELAKTAGLSVGKFRAAVKDGEVSVNVLAETFNRLTGPGGRFFGMFEERSRSAVGQFDALNAKWLMFKQELGKGLLQGMQDTGIFNMMNGWVDKLLTNKDSIREFFDSLIQGIGDLMVMAAQVAGYMSDVFASMRRNWKGMQQETAAFMNVGGMAANALFPGAELVKLNMENAATEAFDGVFQGTGERWAAEAEKFRSIFKPAIADAFSPITTTGSLPPRLQKLLDSVAESQQKGTTPYEQFQRQLEDADRIRQFYRRQGMFNGTAESGADSVMVNAYMALEKSMTAAVDRFPAAMSKGSQEAASTIMHAAFGGDSRTLQEKMLDTIKLAKKANEDTARNTADILKAMSGPNGIPVKR